MRTTGLARALAETGYDMHPWCLGGPNLPGHEQHGQARLHRWCQWITRSPPADVYDGQEGKRLDHATSAPPFLYQHVLLSTLGRESES